MRENVWCARQGVGRKTGVSILDWDHVFVCLLKSIPFFILLCILSFLMNSFILMYAWVHLLLYQCSFPTPPPTPGMKTLKKQWLEVLSTYQFVLCFFFLGKRIRGPLGKVGKGKVG